MLNDVSECRQHAARCAELAQAADSLEAKQMLVELALGWLRLATHLEQRHALIDALAIPSPGETKRIFPI